MFEIRKLVGLILLASVTSAELRLISYRFSNNDCKNPDIYYLESKATKSGGRLCSPSNLEKEVCSSGVVNICTADEDLHVTILNKQRPPRDWATVFLNNMTGSSETINIRTGVGAAEVYFWAQNVCMPVPNRNLYQIFPCQEGVIRQECSDDKCTQCGNATSPWPVETKWYTSVMTAVSLNQCPKPNNTASVTTPSPKSPNDGWLLRAGKTLTMTSLVLSLLIYF